jgi:hypothetical protein
VKTGATKPCVEFRRGFYANWREFREFNSRQFATIRVKVLSHPYPSVVEVGKKNLDWAAECPTGADSE